MKRLRSFHAFLLASASISLSAEGAVKWTGRANSASGAFFTQWDGYKNQYFSLGAAIEAEGERFHMAAEVQYRNDLALPVLGNIPHLYYGSPSSSVHRFLLGRLPAITSASEYLSIKERLNHRVCYTGFECSRGGPIGLHYAYQQSTAFSLELLSLPDIYPLVQINDDGSLSSENRWTAAPIQYVDIDGVAMPVRVSTKFAEGIGNFFKPGIHFNQRIVSTQIHLIRFGGAWSLSREITTVDGNAIRFVEDPSGEAIAVANSDKSATLKYRQLVWLSSVHKLSPSVALHFESASEKHGDDHSFSLLGGSVFKNRWSNMRLTGGLLRGQQIMPGLDFRGRIQLGSRWAVSVWTLATFPKNLKSGWLLEPSLQFKLTKKLTTSLKGFFIQADSEDSLLGFNRGNDHYGGGLRYEF